MPNVAITARTRKILWSRAGNGCARCEATLVHTPEAAGDPHAIVGRECHIVARAPSGPRGAAWSRLDLDGYENLILLCANCHAVVDGAPERFPPEELKRLKAAHEETIARRSIQGLPEIKLHGRERPLKLRLVHSGDALLSLIAPAFSIAYAHSASLSPSQRELVGDFQQTCHDWGEAYDDIGPKMRLEAGGHLQDMLDALRGDALVAYAGARTLTLTGGDHSFPWPEVVVRVVHERDARG